MSDTLTKRPRADWQMPEKPQEACDACGEPLKAIAYSEDGWELWWGCNNYYCRVCQDGLGGLTIGEMGESIIEWPFQEDDTANIAELSALGFEMWAA